MIYSKSKSRNRYQAGRDLIRVFSSPEELLSYSQSVDPKFSRFSDDANGKAQLSWAGDSGDNAVHALQFGSKKYLERAERLIENMKDQGIFSHGQKIWETSVVGSFPCVPHAVMGLPDTMYQLCETDLISTTTPLRIYVNTTSSGSTTTEQMINRGVAMLGLVMAMQQVRPIELYVVSAVDPKNDNSAFGTCTRIETNPLDLDRATFMLCDPSFARQIGYGLAHSLAGLSKNNAFLPFPWGQWGLEDEQSMRACLGMAPDDLYMCSLFGGYHKYLSDPIGWIKDYLEAHKNPNHND